MVKLIQSLLTCLAICWAAGLLMAQEPADKKEGPQAPAKTEPKCDPKTPQETVAYRLLVLRKVQLEGELAALLKEYGKEWPKCRRLQFQIDAVTREIDGITFLPEWQAPKLSATYGALAVKRAEVEGELQALLLEYTSDWPAVAEKRAVLKALTREIDKLLYQL